MSARYPKPVWQVGKLHYITEHQQVIQMLDELLRKRLIDMIKDVINADTMIHDLD